jgi:NADH:ubiquinone reductase (H+-translocating)
VSAAGERSHVIVIGGGFAGLGCTRKLAKHRDVRVTLLDRNNYHQFQPMLYQVATSQLGSSNIAMSLRKIFRKHPNVDIKMAEVASVDPATCTVTATDGGTWTGDAVVVAAGSQPNFFGTPGADSNSFPLYSLHDAQRLRSRIIGIFEDADRDPSLLDRGALNFVIVGGGATGVETAGALVDLIQRTMMVEYRTLSVDKARVHIVDLGHSLLGPFSEHAHDYAAKVLQRKGVELHLDMKVTEVAPDHVTLGDESEIRTRCVVWGGGIMAPPVAAALGAAQGRGGRIDVRPELTVPGYARVYAVGDVANVPGPDGQPLPQLGSVALQSGVWAAKNLLADLAGRPPKPFRYKDKGIMAMIGRGSAIAAMGEKRREVHGPVAFAAWLGVHLLLMTGARARVRAVVDWIFVNVSRTRGPQLLDRSGAAEIDWSDDRTTEPSNAATSTEPSTAATSTEPSTAATSG